MVAICCVTYNHKNTIIKAIDSFLMQKTNFNYKIYIHDDCSTDGTTKILQNYESKYPKKIKVIYQKENQMGKGKRPFIDFIFPVINSKYIALCEGDDWWIDENKLQIQIDLLESDNNLTGCFHLTEMMDLETNKFVGYYPFKKSKRQKMFTLKDNFFAPPTSSVVYRFDIFKEKILSLYPNNIVNGDTWFASFYLLNGNIAYINKAMSARTINGNGIWVGKNVTEDNRNIRFAKEIINFPLEMEKLFTIYGKTSPFSFIEAYEKVINSAIKYNKPDLINSINNDFFIQYFKTKEKIYTHQINKIKQKYKKYKKITTYSILISMLILILILIVKP